MARNVPWPLCDLWPLLTDAVRLNTCTWQRSCLGKEITHTNSFFEVFFCCTISDREYWQLHQSKMLIFNLGLHRYCALTMPGFSEKKQFYFNSDNIFNQIAIKMKRPSAVFVHSLNGDWNMAKDGLKIVLLVKSISTEDLLSSYEVLHTKGRIMKTLKLDFKFENFPYFICCFFAQRIWGAKSSLFIFDPNKYWWEGPHQWGRRLEGWFNTAARLAGWRSMTHQGVILYVTDGPCRLPWWTTQIASGADLLLNVLKTPTWAQSRKEGMACTLVDPCLLSGPHSLTGCIKQSTASIN